MTELGFVNLLIVVAVAFAIPFVLGLAPELRFPSVVLEIVAGIVIGQSGLGWVEVDGAIEVIALVGLAFLLFLAGLEIDPERLRGAVVRLTAVGFVVSIGLAVVIAFGLQALDLAETPLLIAIVLTATSLGVIVPVLKDAGEISSEFAQLIVAAASIADFGAIILLSIFFSRDGAGTGAQLITLGLFAAAVVAAGLAVAGVSHLRRVGSVLLHLQDSTAQIRVRGAFVALVGLAALAGELGLEVILGAFAAGLILAVIDRDAMATHPLLHVKLDAAGYGIFIPVFFVASGVRFDLDALLAGASTVAMVPIFLVALIVVRGVPALIYAKRLGRRRTFAAALLQSTSLPFIVAATAIGVEIGALEPATAAALVAAGLLSVLLFPALALAVLRPRSAAVSATTPARLR